MENFKHLDKKVKQSYRRFKIKGTPTHAELRLILRKLGYVTQPYMNEHIKHFGRRIPPAYTIESNDSRLVLYNDALSDHDLTIAFAHELAHIILCHSRRHDGPDDTSTYQDYEADIFAYRFLNHRSLQRTSIAHVIFAIAILVIIATSAYVQGSNHFSDSAVPATADESEVVITSSGTEYHRPHCFYIKNKTNTIILTEDEAIQANKEPCDVCIPQEPDSSL